MFAQILGEINCAFVHFQQGLDRCAFRINHVMIFKLDVEKFKCG